MRRDIFSHLRGNLPLVTLAPTLALILALIASLVPATTALAAGCAISNGIGLPRANTFNVNGGFASSFLQGAVDLWQDKCSDFGHDYPMMQVDTAGDIDINVIFNNRARDDQLPGDGCESTVVHQDANDNMTGATITIWSQERGGDACDANTEDLLAHGLGHALGFDDALDSSCNSTIMGTPIPGQRMTVMDEHCNMLDTRWNTMVEDDPCLDPEATRCECDPFETCTPSPIVLDLDGRGFRFTGMERTVLFDIDADGFLERVTWTDRGSEGFLGLDRDGNGSLDHGGELFGNFTTLADGSTAPHGYVALAEYDQPAHGGNANGAIDPGDAVFGQLEVWFDWSHDGLYQAGEAATLDELGVQSIELSYIENRRRDRHGNLLRYNGKAWGDSPGQGSKPIQATDVFFLEVPR